MEYDSVTQVAHGLEDRMQEIRRAGHVADPDELSVLFRGLDCLESMVGEIRANGQMPAPNPELAAVLTNRLDKPTSEPPSPALVASASTRSEAKKKAQRTIP